MVHWLLCSSLLQFCSTWVFKEKCKVYCGDFDGLWKNSPFRLSRRNTGSLVRHRGRGRHRSTELSAHRDGLCVCGGGGVIWLKITTPPPKKKPLPTTTNLLKENENKIYLHFELFVKFPWKQTCKDHLWTLGGRPYPQTSVGNFSEPPDPVMRNVMTEMLSEEGIIRWPPPSGSIPGCTFVNPDGSLLHAEGLWHSLLLLSHKPTMP